MTAAGLATWVTFDGGGVQHALRTNTRTECGRRTQGHDVTPGPRNSLRRGCVLCTRRIDGYNAYGDLQRASTLLLTQIDRGNEDAVRLAAFLCSRPSVSRSPSS